MAATSVFSICTLIYGQKLRHKKSAKLRSDNSMENENDIAILSSSEMTSTTQDGTLGDGLISNK